MADAAAEVVQSNQYYPFGLSYANGIRSGKQPYKHSGKEQDNWNGLNMYDFEARWMNTVIPMFTTQDPHAENYPEWSPYVYVMNNPMNPLNTVHPEFDVLLIGRLFSNMGEKVVHKSLKRTTVKGANSNSLVSLTDETFSQASLKEQVGNLEYIGNYTIWSTKGLVGNTFNRNIFYISTPKELKSLEEFRSLVKTIENEALNAGASKVSIYGSSIINEGFF